MKMKTLLSVWMVLFCFTALAAGQDYVVGEGDVLKIIVYENDDLTTTVRVSGENAIVVPLIGRVDVNGRSISQIADRIKTLLADGYLVDPHVSIFIEEFRSRNVTVLGEVGKPGLYELSEETTLLELLSKAGGASENAGSQAIIKRRQRSDKNTLEIIRIDLRRLLEEGDITADITVRDQDSIFIPKADLFYINGQVHRPAAYKCSSETTLLKAVTMAGGFTNIASRSRIKIIRNENGQKTVISRAKMDASILPDDIIVVPESFF
jgi:polysaccharide export outer membrane protein